MKLKMFNGMLCAAVFMLITSMTNNAAFAQRGDKGTQQKRGPEDFPELVFTEIPGAPKLTHPILVMGETKPVMGEGMGWASPAFHDVNGDGKKDLLIGEFGSRMEDNGIAVGNFVRVYANIGSQTEPKFNDFYNYLMPINALGSGVPLSVSTWCCLGFTPRFVDLDNDGIEDLVTGQYDPGFITWFKRNEEGFHPGVKLPQYGDHMLGRKMYDRSRPWTDPDNWAYWNYSSAAFGDFDGDGLQDMITGGTSLRISKNIGKKNEPSFGRRELLLDTQGNPLTVLANPDTTIGYYWGEPNYGSHMIPFVFDWDGDGLLDLLVTNFHGYDGDQVVTFFKAVQTDKGLRFEPGISLVEAKDGTKAFPGSNLHLYVADWNDDGVNDLIIGASMTIKDGKFDSELSWGWEGANKSYSVNTAYFSAEFKYTLEKTLANLKANYPDNPEMYKEVFEKSYGKEEYKNLAHQGYVYVMLGRKEGDD